MADPGGPPGISSAIASGAAFGGNTAAGGSSPAGNAMQVGGSVGIFGNLGKDQALFASASGEISGTGDGGVSIQQASLGNLGFNAFGDVRGKSGMAAALTADLDFSAFGSGTASDGGGDASGGDSGSDIPFPTSMGAAQGAMDGGMSGGMEMGHGSVSPSVGGNNTEIGGMGHAA